ncbi:MAG: ketoacyl-ACP synthase III [Bacteroidales bacterium]|jgi:3-oxoacyl-[acyl-carrier-protein] synthase-3
MRIIGTGSALPSFTLTNDMLTGFLETSDEWIVSRTGIKQRQIITSEKLEDLAAEAAIKALENANIKASDLDFIICSNVINEYITPSISCIVQGKIGAKCPCIDINGACAGFIYALDIAQAYFQSGRVKNVLVVCAEEPTRMVDWKERDLCVLFGDGAGALILTGGDNCKAIKLSTLSKTESLYQIRTLQPTPFINKEEIDGPLVMKGKDVFKLAVVFSLKDIRSVLKIGNIAPEDVDYYLLHQANIRIVDTIRNNLGLDESKFLHNIENHGNTSSASIPILIDQMNKENKFKKGDKLVFSAFGAGFTTGACLIYW